MPVEPEEVLPTEAMEEEEETLEVSEVSVQTEEDSEEALEVKEEEEDSKTKGFRHLVQPAEEDKLHIPIKPKTLH